MTITIRPTLKRITSDVLSLSQDVVKGYVEGYVKRIEVRDEDDVLVEYYQGRELDNLIGSGISNGKIFPKEGNRDAWYYLGKRIKV